MTEYIIIENEKGYLVVRVEEGQSVEQAAVANNGVIVDAGPFHSYEEACDAMQLIPDPVDDLDGEK